MRCTWLTLLLGLIICGFAVSTPVWAQANSCLDPNCNINGSHKWVCLNNGKCALCGECGSCAPGTTACGFACCPAGVACADHDKSLCGGCTPGATSCNGKCSNLSNDPSNCGHCGVQCSAPSNGTPLCLSVIGGASCGFSCNAGFTRCGNNCFDLKNDPDHCGQCDNECDGAPNNGTDKCFNGQCGFVCNEGFSTCQGSCVDLPTDPDNCGACGNKCGANQTCTKGVCVGFSGCGAGSFDSGGGQCQACPPGSISSAGAHHCTQCLHGTFAGSPGSVFCALAPAGSFVAFRGASSATPCPAGNFSANPGSFICTPCPPGTTSKPGARSCIAGAVLCRGTNFTGICQTFDSDIADLRGSVVGNDTASSIRVGNDCPGATLCTDINFGGVCQTFTSDNPDLLGSLIQRNQASSIRAGGICPGALLCSEANFQGICERFVTDNADLRNSVIGNDTASSLSVGAGMIVSLYRDINFEGTCQEFKVDILDLGSTVVGSHTVSSIHLGPCICKPGHPCNAKGP